VGRWGRGVAWAQLPQIEHYSGDLWSRPALTGEWGGLRNTLATNGINLDVDLVHSLQGLNSGGLANDSALYRYGGHAKDLLHVDTGKLGLWPGGFLRLKGESQFSPYLRRNDTGTLLPPAALYPMPFDEETTLTSVVVTQFLAQRSRRQGLSQRLRPTSSMERHFAGRQIVDTGFDPDLGCFQRIANNGRGCAQQIGLKLGVVCNRFPEVAARVFNRGLDILVKRADLTRNGVGLHGRLDSSAARVTEHEEHFDAEDGDGVFETRHNFRRDDIAGDPSDKDVADGLIKHEFDGHARVGTGEDGGKGLLLLDGVFLENPEVVLDGGELIVVKALVACHEFTKRCVGSQGGLSQEGPRQGSLDSGHGSASYRTREHIPEKLPPRDRIGGGLLWHGLTPFS
jgi:hypothetical protein